MARARSIDLTFLVSTTRSFLGPNVHACVHDDLPLTPKSSPSQKMHNDRRSGSSYTNRLLTPENVLWSIEGRRTSSKPQVLN